MQKITSVISAVLYGIAVIMMIIFFMAQSEVFDLNVSTSNFIEISCVCVIISSIIRIVKRYKR